MTTHRRSGLRESIERGLLERDRREIAWIEQLMKALQVETQPARRKNAPPPRTRRTPRNTLRSTK